MVNVKWFLIAVLLFQSMLLPVHATQLARRYLLTLQISLTGIAGTTNNICQYELTQIRKTLYRTRDCNNIFSTATVTKRGKSLFVNLPMYTIGLLTDGINVFATQGEERISCSGTIQGKKSLFASCNGTTSEGFFYNGFFNASPLSRILLEKLKQDSQDTDLWDATETKKLQRLPGDSYQPYLQKIAPQDE